jgi:hypothetical protein
MIPREETTISFLDLSGRARKVRTGFAGTGELLRPVEEGVETVV